MPISSAGKILISGKKSINGRFGCHAFTLLELLVVLVIIGLMAAGVMPAVGDRLDSLKFRTEAKKIAATMRYARSMAVSENRVFRVIFDTRAGNMKLITRLDETGSTYPWETAVSPVETETRGTYDLYEGMEVRAEGEDHPMTDGLLEYLFYPSGGASGEALLLLGNKHQFRITLDAFSGDVRMEDGAGRAAN